jgi:hypothetical protein
MDRISSSRTYFTKRIFPAIWLGIVGLGLVIGVATGAWRKEPVVVIQPVVMAAFGYILFRKLVWDLADEVRDAGTHLLVRKGDVEERIALANVMNVDTSRFVNPRRITLRLRVPGKLGEEVAFIPKATYQFNPFARNEVAEALIKRIDRTRQAS